MHLDFKIKRPAVLLLAGLCTFSLVCEVMRVQNDEADLRAHQARFDCLVGETGHVPRCVSLLKQRPMDDADFCEEAVARCKAGPTYDGVDKAEARRDTWFRLATWSRLATFVGVVGSLAWVGVGRFIRRRV